MNIIAQTILSQLGPQFQILIHVKQYVVGERSLAILFSDSKIADKVVIELCPNDTYTVTFYKRIRGGIFVDKVKEYENVYCDMLQELFETTTGLYVHF